MNTLATIAAVIFASISIQSAILHREQVVYGYESPEYVEQKIRLHDKMMEERGEAPPRYSQPVQAQPHKSYTQPVQQQQPQGLAKPVPQKNITRPVTCMGSKDNYEWTNVHQPLFGNLNIRHQKYQVVPASVFEIRYDPWTGARITDDGTREFVSEIVYNHQTNMLRLVGVFDSRNGTPINRHCRY